MRNKQLEEAAGSVKMQAEVVLTAVCSLIGSLAATFAGIMVNSKLSNYRIEQLEKKVDKHNNLVERTYKLEQDLAVLDEQQRVANHRISDLENKTEAERK